MEVSLFQCTPIQESGFQKMLPACIHSDRFGSPSSVVLQSLHLLVGRRCRAAGALEKIQDLRFRTSADEPPVLRFSGSKL